MADEAFALFPIFLSINLISNNTWNDVFTRDTTLDMGAHTVDYISIVVPCFKKEVCQEEFGRAKRERVFTFIYLILGLSLVS
jgi:hypothetical protein